MESLIQFTQDQKAELLNDGFFKTYTHCSDCGNKYIFKNFDLKTKKVCMCQSNNWIIDNIVEC
jgi:uncharacterized protein (DUF983 family)